MCTVAYYIKSRHSLPWLQWHPWSALWHMWLWLSCCLVPSTPWCRTDILYMGRTRHRAFPRQALLGAWRCSVADAWSPRIHSGLVGFPSCWPLLH